MSDMRNTMNLVESLLTQRDVLSVETTPYELTALMREYRSSDWQKSELEDRAVLAFYSPEEKASFEKFLKSKGVSYSNVGVKD